MYPCKSSNYNCLYLLLCDLISFSSSIYGPQGPIYSASVYVTVHSQTPRCISADPSLTMSEPMWPSWLQSALCTSLTLTLKANDGTVLGFISPHASSHSCASADRGALASRTHAHLSFRKIRFMTSRAYQIHVVLILSTIKAYCTTCSLKALKRMCNLAPLYLNVLDGSICCCNVRLSRWTTDLNTGIGLTCLPTQPETINSEKVPALSVQLWSLLSVELHQGQQRHTWATEEDPIETFNLLLTNTCCRLRPCAAAIVTALLSAEF